MIFIEQALHKSSTNNVQEFENQIQELNNSDIHKLKQLISKLYFQIPNTNIGIPASTYRHDTKKHQINANDWDKLIKNIKYPKLFVEAKKGKAFRGINYLYKYKIGKLFYGLAICRTKKLDLITTFFQDTEGSIDNWLIGNGKTQPEVPTANYVPGCSLCEGSSNIIITCNSKNVNNMNEQLVYHGTNTKFQQFDKSFMDRMDYGYGFYFTIDKSYAKDYGKYLLTCEIPDDKYFMDFKLSWDYNEYIADCLINLLMSIKDTDKRIKLQNVMFRDYCNDGFWILETLSKIFNGQQNACNELVKFGIKGLYSLEGNCYVVFDNKDIKIIKTELTENYKKHNIFKTLNEQLELYINEEAAMLKARQDTFEQFYNYCIKNPKLQQKIYYECFNGHIRIPSDTINHAWKKHKTTCEQWLDALSSLTNIQEASKSKDKTLGRPTFLCRILGYKDFGIAMADCPDYLYIMTLFVDHINSINNWIQTGSIRRPASQLPAPVSNADSVTHDGLEPNNIIQYIIEKIKR